MKVTAFCALCKKEVRVVELHIKKHNIELKLGCRCVMLITIESTAVREEHPSKD
jgi:hypothetical protein